MDLMEYRRREMKSLEAIQQELEGQRDLHDLFHNLE